MHKHSSGTSKPNQINRWASRYRKSLLERCALLVRIPCVNRRSMMYDILLHYHRGCSDSLFIRHTNAVVPSRSVPAGSSRADQKNGDRSTMENRALHSRELRTLSFCTRCNACALRAEHKIFGCFLSARWHR